MADSEHILQVGVVAWLRCNGYDVASDQGGLRTSYRQAKRAKAAGMMAGEPDLRIYLPGGKLCLIEMKAATGRVSTVQKERHAVLASLGFPVHVVQAATIRDAIDKVKGIMVKCH